MPQRDSANPLFTLLSCSVRSSTVELISFPITSRIAPVLRVKTPVDALTDLQIPPLASEVAGVGGVSVSVSVLHPGDRR